MEKRWAKRLLFVTLQALLAWNAMQSDCTNFSLCSIEDLTQSPVEIRAKWTKNCGQGDILRPWSHSGAFSLNVCFMILITSTHTETKNSFGDIFLFDSHSEIHSHGHRISGWASPLHHPQLLNLRNQSPQPIDPGFVSKQRETGRDGDNGQTWTRQNWALIMVLGSPMFPAIFLYILVVY